MHLEPQMGKDSRARLALRTARDTYHTLEPNERPALDQSVNALGLFTVDNLGTLAIAGAWPLPDHAIAYIRRPPRPRIRRLRRLARQRVRAVLAAARRRFYTDPPWLRPPLSSPSSCCGLFTRSELLTLAAAGQWPLSPRVIAFLQRPPQDNLAVAVAADPGNIEGPDHGPSGQQWRVPA